MKQRELLQFLLQPTRLHHIDTSLESVIKTDVDYVLLFLDENAANSEWVRKEIKWAIETENKLSRSFLLPVVIDDPAVAVMIPELANRKYLQVKDFNEDYINGLSSAISSELFALVCRDLHQSREQKNIKKADTITEAEDYLNNFKAMVTKIVFPHRRGNPITKSVLLECLNEDLGESKITVKELDSILNAITQRGLIPGLSYDGYELFLSREHVQWKTGFGREGKIKIARKTSSMIRSGHSVYIDAGSTTEEVVKILCQRIETRTLTHMVIATTSVNHAGIISDCCVSMGFDDDYSAVE